MIVIADGRQGERVKETPSVKVLAVLYNILCVESLLKYDSGDRVIFFYM